jgi:hypothetical protein
MPILAATARTFGWPISAAPESIGATLLPSTNTRTILRRTDSEAAMQPRTGRAYLLPVVVLGLAAVLAGAALAQSGRSNLGFGTLRLASDE